MLQRHAHAVFHQGIPNPVYQRSFAQHTATGSRVLKISKIHPTNHLLTITAVMKGTMYVRPPVSSNMITTRDTVTVNIVSVATHAVQHLVGR